jgi:hypothetical protein
MIEDLKNAHINLTDNELYAILDHWWLVEGRMQEWLGGAITKKIETNKNED